MNPIPENPKRNEAAHEHYDLLAFFRCTGSEEFTVSDESGDLKWMTADEVLAANDSPRFRRLVAKWRSFMKHSQAA